jgi:uncharacterized protein (UPF0332 family)
MLPQHFLALAEQLAAANGPAECRSAISRAYYSVYHVGEQFLKRMNFERPKKDYHVVLQRRLLASGDHEINRIGSDLVDFHRERIQADYRLDDHFPENKNNAIAAVAKAKQMIAQLEGCAIHGARWKGIRASIAKANVTGTDNLVGPSDV